ncbi:progestin and adipoQ receptor family member 3-like [Amphiura filiformis]|uniref:progestin and adipoQ receptor family member 3-like n=1 Tax=Amphiura filiformis TaxID=82378 RepID=UPI003B224E14
MEDLLTSGYSLKGIILHSYAEVPHYLQGNPFIIKGYRNTLSASQCIQSLLVWSNESINVWTHIIGFLIFLLLAVYDNAVTIPELQGSWTDHIIYTVYLSCFQFCMLCSAGYHLFCCHSEAACKRWLGLDIAGISIGLLGCYFPAVYYAFYCFQYWRNVHLVIVCTLMMLTIIVQLHRRFLTARWATQRLMLYISAVAYGVGPVVHWIYLNGGFQAPIIQKFVPMVCVMYVLGILALLFYATKFPERCFPGKLDYIGSSHQWWHIIVVIAFLWWHHCGLQFTEYRYSTACSQTWHAASL